jgi:Serine incorporator (Serinc)
VVKTDSDGKDDVYIGRSETAMWMRVVSSWMCMLLYIWSLVAPVLVPDRYVTSHCPLFPAIDALLIDSRMYSEGIKGMCLMSKMMYDVHSSVLFA